MKKAEIKTRINAIPFEMLRNAVYAIEHSNPNNEIFANRAYIWRNISGGICTDVEIGFQARATKENMLNVYHEILDQIICCYGIVAAHEIDPDYTPVWYADSLRWFEEVQKAQRQEEENESVADPAAVVATISNESGDTITRAFTWPQLQEARRDGYTVADADAIAAREIEARWYAIHFDYEKWMEGMRSMALYHASRSGMPDPVNVAAGIVDAIVGVYASNRNFTVLNAVDALAHWIESGELKFSIDKR